MTSLSFVYSIINHFPLQLTAKNHPHVTEPIFTKAMNNMRTLRYRSMNEYRKRFELAPYKSFKELTGEDELSKVLEELYVDIDAVEYYVGLLVEEPGPSVTGATMVNIGGPWSVKGLLSNPICSPRWWKPSTFGGQVGMDIIKSASLEKLFCKNMKSKCKNINLKLTIPS